MRESGNHVNASTRLFHVLMLFSAMGAAQLAKSYDDYACVFQTDGQTEIAWDENTICRVSERRFRVGDCFVFEYGGLGTYNYCIAL